MAEKILQVKNLKTYFHTEAGLVKAVNEVSFDVEKGKTLGIVGESGCGKSITSLSIMGLVEKPGNIEGGEILFEGEDLLKKTEVQMRAIRGKKIAMIFQDVGASLDPIRIVESQYRESILAHRKMAKADCRSLEKEMLAKMHLTDPERVMVSYPFELSGGMKQRVGIAMSMTARQRLLLADEPTSALDVTIQAEVVREMKKLREQYETAIILVTHNMGVASYISDKIGVMCKGELVEFGKRDDVIFHPKHEYTKKLLAAVPRLEGKRFAK